MMKWRRDSGDVVCGDSDGAGDGDGDEVHDFTTSITSQESLFFFFKSYDPIPNPTSGKDAVWLELFKNSKIRRRSTVQ